MTNTEVEGYIFGIADPFERLAAVDELMSTNKEALSVLSSMRGEIYAELLRTYSSDYVAERLDVDRNSVYRSAARKDRGLGAQILEGSESHDMLPRSSYDRPLLERLEENERLLRHVADGRAPSIPLGRFGSQILADVLVDAIHVLSGEGQRAGVVVFTDEEGRSWSLGLVPKLDGESVVVPMSLVRDTTWLSWIDGAGYVVSGPAGRIQEQSVLVPLSEWEQRVPTARVDHSAMASGQLDPISYEVQVVSTLIGLAATAGFTPYPRGRFRFPYVIRTGNSMNIAIDIRASSKFNPLAFARSVRERRNWVERELPIHGVMVIVQAPRDDSIVPELAGALRGVAGGTLVWGWRAQDGPAQLQDGISLIRELSRQASGGGSEHA